MREDVLKVLKKARELISDPAHWCTDAFARDKFGTPVAIEDPDACQFCSLGALRFVSGVGGAYEGPGFDLYDAAANELYSVSVALFGKGAINVNDEYGHGATVAMFDEAIKAGVQKEVRS